jgi:hypothetical protein
VCDKALFFKIECALHGRSVDMFPKFFKITSTSNFEIVSLFRCRCSPQNSKLCNFDYCFFGLRIRFGFSTFISLTTTINGITLTGGGTGGVVAVMEDMNTKI